MGKENIQDTLLDIIIDLRKALLGDNNEIRTEVAKQITRLYVLKATIKKEISYERL